MGLEEERCKAEDRSTVGGLHETEELRLEKLTETRKNLSAKQASQGPSDMQGGEPMQIYWSCNQWIGVTSSNWLCY